MRDSRTGPSRFGFAALLLAMMSAPVSGQVVVSEDQQLVPDPVPTVPDLYGSHVAVDAAAGIAVVGSVANGNIGAAYIYRRSLAGVWDFEQKLQGQTLFEAFGRTAVQGDVIAVGAPDRNLGLPEPGAVDLFRWNGTEWELESTLIPTTTHPNADFGGTIALHDDVLVVGAPNDTVPPVTSAGNVRVYRDQGPAGWVEEAVLSSTVPVNFAEFGRWVSTDGELIAVGEWGAVHLFRHVAGVWTLDFVLTGTTNNFGLSGAVLGDVLAVGNPDANGDVGEVRIYRYSSGSWQLEYMIPGDPAVGDWGALVALEQDVCLAAREQANGQGVHRYRNFGGVWTETETLMASSAEPSFGGAVAASGSLVVVGATDGEMTPGVGTGAAYLFDFSTPEFRRGDLNDDGSFNIADAITSLSGIFPPISLVGCPDAADSNDDGAYDIADPIYLLTWLFSPGSPPPAEPHDTCGPDPTSDTLPCGSFGGCP